MPKTKLPKKETQDFHAFLNKEAKFYCHQFTVAIFALQFQKIVQCGSGVLVSIGNHNFLITAAHTIDAHFHLGLPIFISNEVEGAGLLDINRSHVLMSKTDDPHNRSDDPIDICVCDLRDDVVVELKKKKRFATLMDIDTNDSRLPANSYMVFGYPSEMNQVDYINGKYSTRALAFSAFQCREELSKFNSNMQIALFYFGGVSFDDNREATTPPDPHGISGGGIWRVHDQRIPPELWSVDQIKLTAIEHAIVDKKALVGTSINLALGFILLAFPDLKPIFELHVNGIKAARKGLLCN